MNRYIPVQTILSHMEVSSDKSLLHKQTDK